jgi:hypothetical protein
MAFDPLSPLPGGERSFPINFNPQFKIVRVSSNGLVVRCTRAFEAGSTIGLGVHLHMEFPAALAERSHGSPDSDAMARDSFVDFKGIVVDCQEIESADSESVSVHRSAPLFELTLFFDSITDEQCAALLLAGRESSNLEASSRPLPEFLEWGGAGFDRVCGLN